MNIIDLASFITVAGCGVLGFWVVRLELELRTHRRQIVRLINHHNKLLERFENFMFTGGQGVVKRHFEDAWNKGNHLSHCKGTVLPSLSSCDLGPIFTDVDAAAALPPFVQDAKPWDKNVQPPAQSVTE